MWWDLIPGVGKIIDKVLELIPDPNERARAEEQLQAAEQSSEIQVALAQIKVNEVEAASSSLFVSGGRPAFLWLGVAILAWNYMLAPSINFLADCIHGVAGAPHIEIFNAGEIMAIVTGVLGLGAMRSYDRQRGTADGQSPASRQAAVTTHLKAPAPILVQR
jgi:hypothetical protein